MKRHGFTLIEVLISMGVIGVGLIALVTLFPVGLRSSRLAGDFTTASFIGQQALDSIRAAAQVYDPGDMGDEDMDGDRFDDPDGDGVGYYELPVSAVKGSLWNISFPEEPTQSQTWTITITLDHAPPGTLGTFDVTNSITGGSIGTGTINSYFSPLPNTSTPIEFLLLDNQDGPDIPVYGWGAPLNIFNEGAFPFNNSDIDYPEFEAGDEIVIHLEARAGTYYYWYAMRAPMSEDVDLDGILDGRLPNGTARSAPHNQVQEDVGLDLVPDFFDTDMRDIGVGATAGYQAGLDTDGEFTAAVPFPNDPHGDNRFAYTVAPPNFWWDPASEINPAGAEGNGQIDFWANDYMQRVTVTVGWREGGQDRAATFSTTIPNQFR